jgi:hypothetical protein
LSERTVLAKAHRSVSVFVTNEDSKKGVGFTMSGKNSEQVIIENQEKILANQRKLEEILKNQTAIIGNQEKLDKIIANQEAILKNQEKILAK